MALLKSPPGQRGLKSKKTKAARMGKLTNVLRGSEQGPMARKPSVKKGYQASKKKRKVLSKY